MDEDIARLHVAVEQDASDGLVLRPAMAFAEYIGDFESRRRLAARAVELDASCIHCMGDYITELVRVGRLDEAEALARARMAMAPHGQLEAGQVFMARGEYEKALEIFGEWPYEPDRLVFQALVRHAMGDLDGFARLKAEFSEKYGSPFFMAMLYATEGDTVAAMASLQLEFSESVERFGMSFRDPVFESLHGEPGWEELRERAGLTDADIAGTTLNLPDGI